MKWGPGKLLHIHIAERASSNMKELIDAELVAVKGIVGDRYFNGTGKYSEIPDIRDVNNRKRSFRCFRTKPTSHSRKKYNIKTS